MASQGHQMFGFGVVISLRSRAVQNTNIGLYDALDADGNPISQFRWYLSDYGSLSTPAIGTDYNFSLLAADAIGSIRSAVDLRRGGNIEEISGTEIRVDNTGDYTVASPPLIHALDVGDIQINGCSATVYAVDEDGHQSPTYTGICAYPTWDETSMRIPIEPAINDTPLTTLIEAATYPDAPESSLGEAVPLVYGDVRYAMGLCDAKKVENVVSGTEILLKKSDSVWIKAVESSTSGDMMKITAVDGMSFDGTKAINVIRCKFAKSALWYVSFDQGANWSLILGATALDFDCETAGVSIYCKIADGDGSGQIRKVKRIDNPDLGTGSPTADLNWIELTFYDCLADDVAVSGDGQSWALVYYANTTHVFSTGNVRGFLADDMTTVLSDGVIPSSFDDGRRVPVSVAAGKQLIIRDFDPDYYKITAGDFTITDTTEVGGNSRLAQYSKTQEDDGLAYSAVSYVEPVIRHPDYSVADALTEWCNFAAGFTSNTRYQDLDYKYTDNAGHYRGGMGASISSTGTWDPDRVNTHNFNTESVISTSNVFTTPYDTNDVCLVEIDLPDIVDIPINFDTMTILINAASHSSALAVNGEDYDQAIFLMWKEFDDTPHICSPVKNIVAQEESADTTLRNDFDLFYTSNKPDTSGKFYFPSDPFYLANARDYVQPGILAFEITGINYDNYRKIRKLCLFFGNSSYSALSANRTVDFTNELKTLCIAFVKGTSTEKIYNHFSGRIRVAGETWGSRRSASSLISGPVEIAESICRDGGETVSTVNDEGGFNYSGVYLARLISEFDLCRQISSIDDARVDTMKKAIASDVFACLYSGKIGESAGKSLMSDIVTPYGEIVPTPPVTCMDITLADVVGDISEVSESSIEDIFCEPSISYQFDAGSGSYRQTLSVTHSDADTFDESYVVDTSGEVNTLAKTYLWELSHALYLYFRQINPAPSEISESPWIGTAESAYNKMVRWLAWQGAVNNQAGQFVVTPRRRLSFSIPYFLGRDLDLCCHVGINFPHHTQGVLREALVESVDHNIMEQITTVQVSVYPMPVAEQDTTKDTYDEGSGDAWKDTYTEDTENEIKDTFENV